MRKACVFLAAAMATAPVAAQVATTPTPGSGGQTSVQANPGLGAGGEAIGADVSRPVYLSGKIVIDDGSPVPPNITVERVCGGIAKTVAYADANGQFNFRWSGSSTVLADASDAGTGPSSRTSSRGFGSSQSAGGANVFAADPFGSRMMDCSVRASLAGYTSQSIAVFNHRASDNPEIGTIALHRIAGVEGSSISITSMQAPKQARSVYERGLAALLKNKAKDAAKDFSQAVALYPNYADAWVQLAKLRLAAGSVAEGRKALERAIAADPKLVPPYLELGLFEAKDGNWEESAGHLDRALQLDPVDFPQAWYTDAVANYNLGRYDAAEKSARAAIKLDPRHANPRSGYLLAMVLAEKKDYAGAAAELATFVELSPNAPDLAAAKQRLREMQKLAGSQK